MGGRRCQPLLIIGWTSFFIQFLYFVLERCTSTGSVQVRTCTAYLVTMPEIWFIQCYVGFHFRYQFHLLHSHISVGPSSVVWSELGPAHTFSTNESAWSVMVTGSRSRVWSGPKCSARSVGGWFLVISHFPLIRLPPNPMVPYIRHGDAMHLLFLIRHLHLIGVWLHEDQRANIIN